MQEKSTEYKRYIEHMFIQCYNIKLRKPLLLSSHENFLHNLQNSFPRSRKPTTSEIQTCYQITECVSANFMCRMYYQITAYVSKSQKSLVFILIRIILAFDEYKAIRYAFVVEPLVLYIPNIPQKYRLF